MTARSIVDAEAIACRLDDADVGLVRDHQLDVVGGDAGVLQRLRGRVDHDAHGAAEDLLALHVDEPADLGPQQAPERTVGVEIPGQQLAGTLDRFEHDSAGAVAEQHGGVAVVPVGDPRQRVGADQQHLARAHRDHPVGGDQAVDEARSTPR